MPVFLPKNFELSRILFVGKLLTMLLLCFDFSQKNEAIFSTKYFLALLRMLFTMMALLVLILLSIHFLLLRGLFFKEHDQFDEEEAIVLSSARVMCFLSSHLKHSIQTTNPLKTDQEYKVQNKRIKLIKLITPFKPFSYVT